MLMILARLSDIPKQRNALPPAIVRAIEGATKLDLAGLAPGRYDLDGDRIFCLIQDAAPRALAHSQAEAHRQYIDIQIPVGACERFGFALPESGLMPCDDCLEEKDYALYPTPANEFFMDVAPGSYLVFFPGELHRPCVAIAGFAPFRRAVIKLHVSLLC